MTRKSRSPHKMTLAQFEEYHDTEDMGNPMESRSSQNVDQTPRTPIRSTPARQKISSPEQLSPCGDNQVSSTSPHISSPAGSDTTMADEIAHILNSPTTPESAAMAPNRPSTPTPADSSSTNGLKRHRSFTPPAPITPIKYRDVKTPAASPLPSPTPTWSSVVRGDKTPLTPSPSRSPPAWKISGDKHRSPSTLSNSLNDELTAQLLNELNKPTKDVEMADIKAKEPEREKTPEEKAAIAAELYRIRVAKSIKSCKFEEKRIDQLIERSLDSSASDNEKYFAGIAATIAKYYVHDARKQKREPLKHGIRFGERRGEKISATLLQIYNLIPQRLQHLVDDRNVHSKQGSQPAPLKGNEAWLDENIMNTIIHLSYSEKEEQKRGSVFGMNIGSNINGDMNDMYRAEHGMSWLEYLVNELRPKEDEFRNEAIARFRAQNRDFAKIYTLPRGTQEVVYFWNFSGVHWLAILIEMDSQGWTHYICDSLQTTFEWEKIGDAGAHIEELIQELSGIRPPHDYYHPYYSIKQTSSSIQQNGNDCGAFSTWNALYMLRNCAGPPTNISGTDIRKQFMQTILEALQDKFGPVDALDNEETEDTSNEKNTLEKVEVNTPSSCNRKSQSMSSASTPEKLIPIDPRLIESPTPSLDNSTSSSEQASQQHLNGNISDDFEVVEEPALIRRSSSPEPADILIETPSSSPPMATQASTNEVSNKTPSASPSRTSNLKNQKITSLQFETPDGMAAALAENTNELAAAIAGPDPSPGREAFEAYLFQRSVKGDTCANCIIQKIYEKRMERFLPNYRKEAL